MVQQVCSMAYRYMCTYGGLIEQAELGLLRPVIHLQNQMQQVLRRRLRLTQPATCDMISLSLRTHCGAAECQTCSGL